MPERTLPQLFEESVAAFPGNVLIWEKTGPKYEPTTFAGMRTLVRRFAAGLLDLGLGHGDRAALISEGRRDWIVAELGILTAGAVNVPISVKVDELGDLKFRLAHSGCRMAVVSKSQLGKIRQVRNDLPDLALTIVLDDVDPLAGDEIAASEVFRRGDAFLATREAQLEAARLAVRESDPANICYTSGTTADPKGIVLTHRNYTANIEQSKALVDCPEHYVSLLILPWDHSFCHTCGIYSMMKSGAAMASVELGRTLMETLRNIPGNIREVRPHLLLSVPSLAKSFRKNIEKGVRDKGPLAQALFKRALALAVDYNAEGWNRGQGLKKLKKPLLAFYDKLLFAKIRENFGGRLKFFVGGGALLDIEMQRFFYAIGMPMRPARDVRGERSRQLRAHDRGQPARPLADGAGDAAAASALARLPARGRLGGGGPARADDERVLCQQGGRRGARRLDPGRARRRRDRRRRCLLPLDRHGDGPRYLRGRRRGEALDALAIPPRPGGRR